VTGALEYALAYARLGWLVLPIKPGEKVPLAGQGLKHATRDEKTIQRWFKRHANAGIGIALAPSGLAAVDIDPRNGGDLDLRDRMPATLTAATGGGGLHLVYSVPPGASLRSSLGPGIDIKHQGYIVAEPSVHPSGKRYGWLDFEPVEGEKPQVADAPAELMGSDIGAAMHGHEHEAETITPEQLADLRSALHALAADDRQTWIENGQRLVHLGAIGRDLWLAWSRTSDKFDAADADRVWASLNGTRTGYKAIFAAAQGKGWVNPAARPDGGSEPAAARRERQRKLAQDIGDGNVGVTPLARVMSLHDMIEGLVFIADGSRVAHRERPQITLPLNEFKLAHKASETPVGKKLVQTVDLWVSASDRVTTHTMTFRPGHAEFTSDPEGAEALNLWRPYTRPAVSANVAPFLQHVEYLVPVQAERERFLDWLAHIEQRPGVLPHTHYLMVTPQTGIGRNWLASLLARVWVGATRLGFDLVGAMDSGFNGPLSRRLLVIVDELKAADTGYGAGQHAQALKAMLTTEHRTINPKYGRQHIEFNCARFLMLSQHFDALPLERADRRVIVVSNPTERRPPDYYRRLYALLDDVRFVGAVAAWMARRDIQAFNPSEPAPENAAKSAAIEANLGDIERALIALRDGTPEKVMTAAAIAQYLADCGIRQIPPRALSSAYAAAGMAPCRALVRLHDRKHRVVALRDGARLREASGQHLLALLTG
jgi:hypothetical protein